MGFWIALGIFVVGNVLGELLRPRMKFDEPTPSSLGDFSVPTIEEGRPIPVVWGTCRLEGPMVTWYGDLLVQPVKKWYDTGWWSGVDVTIGHKYWLGMCLVLCSGELDEVVHVGWEEKTPGQTRTVEETRTLLYVNRPNFWGGTDSEGGVYGTIRVYHGGDTQVQDPYLMAHMPLEPPADVPAYKGVAYAVLPLMYLGMSPYLKTMSFVVRRFPDQLGVGEIYKNIHDDANPACMIYELLTEEKHHNGLGLPASMIDVDAFTEAAETLWDEGLGLSMMQDRSVPAKDLIQEILKHIDAIMFVEPSTGLLTMKLIRFDYYEEDLPVLDSDNCTVTSLSRPAWAELKNTVRISYVERYEETGIS